MSQMKWLLEQPDNVLNQHEVNREFLHADKTMLHYKVVNEMVHGRVIRREMTKHIDKYSKAVAEEIEHALGVNWGTDITAWREVRLYDTLLDVVARISNRALVGLPLCRDTTYLKSSRTYARSVVLTAGLLNLLPSYLQHLFGPLIMAYDMGHYRKIASYITPIVNTRALHLKPGLDYRTPDYSKHNDYIQWALHDAYSHDEEIERTPEMIAKRLTVLSFAAIQSSVITATNCVFDIASSPKASYIQDMLREEVLRVSDDNPETFWDKKSLSAMVRIDGALRESMRLWGFISRGVMKKVVSPDGVTLPSGQHLPYGSKVGVTSYAIHHDEAIYQNSSVFEPLRFCTGDEAGTATANGSTSMVTSADDFMAFSHGRHAW
jgi:cytochrome P450